MLDRRHKGTYIGDDRGLSFARYLDDWIAGKLALKASTRLSYEHHIELYLKPGLGHLRLTDLRDSDFEELYAAMRLIGRPGAGKPTSVLARLMAVRTDTKQARRPRSGRRPSPVMVWTPAQTGAFLDTVADDRLCALWHLLVFRGLRRSEAVWLSIPNTRNDLQKANGPGQKVWGGRDSNPRPRDYESPALTG